MEPLSITLPVTEVTVLEDRAQVIRRGTVTLPAGTSSLVIDDVAPVLVDKTLTGSIRGASLTGLRVERIQLERPADRPDAVRALEAEAEDLRRERERTKTDATFLSEQVVQLGRVAELALEEFAEDASFGRSDPAPWGVALDAVRSAERDARERGVELASLRRRLKIQDRDLKRRIEAAQTASTERRARLHVGVAAEAAGDVELTIEYLVPGACWRPWHRATLQGERLQLQSDGCVWQNTGEDWDDVELWLSTERASLGVEVPRLSVDRITAQKVGAAVHAETREEQIHDVGLGAGTRKIVPEVPGIDDGGEPRRIRALGRGRVPSDGRPHRLRMSECDSAAEVELLLAAELATAVVTRTAHTNESALPLLPGPVDLVRNSGLVGRTKLDFVAPGERFELGWGPDLDLRVHRQKDQEDLEARLLSSWTTVRHDIEVRLSNIGPEPRTVTVRERIPVSELDKVEVELKRTSPPIEADKDGFLEWMVQVAGYEQETVSLRYTLKRHSDVTGV